MTKVTQISKSTIQMECADLGGQSRLPKFRHQQPSKVQYAAPVGLNRDELENIVDFGVLSMLPYLEQNAYNRDRKLRDMPTIQIENEFLRVTVLPDLGGRIYAVFDKRKNRELLFKNPVFQPANLSLRNAWFSGGIEWNGGAVPGHAASTCSPVFCHIVQSERGPILRIHDFDRISETAWQVDLYLPGDKAQLYVHGRVVNPNNEEKSVYWWTNATVPVTPGLRVLSPADYAIEHAPEDGHLERYDFPDNWGFDGSIPENWQRSTSVFFRSEKQEMPWIAALNEGGNGLAQISTSNLRGRKYFYFGNGAGGGHWMDYLSEAGRGDYIEIQAGIMPTQNQQISMKAHSEFQWSECYFPFDHSAVPDEEFNIAVQKTGSELEGVLPESDFEKIDAWLSKMATHTPNETLSQGDAWGQLYEHLTGKHITPGMKFDAPATRQTPWDLLAKIGKFGDAEPQNMPEEIVVSPLWQKCVIASMEKSGATWLHHLTLGIMAFDRDELLKAEKHLQDSNAIKGNWLALRCLALIAQLAGRGEGAIDLYEKASGFKDAPAELRVEYAMLLQKLGKTKALNNLVSTLPDGAQDNERIRILKAVQALDEQDFAKLEKLLEYNFATIREGEVILSRLWEGLVLGRAEQAAGHVLSPTQKSTALKAAPLPLRLNFVMNDV